MHIANPSLPYQVQLKLILFYSIYTSASITYLLPPHYAGAFPFSAASIFLLAANIISSLLLCRFACLSFRSALHAFALGFSSDTSSTCSNLDAKLYLVIRSGLLGFGALDAPGAAVGVRDAGGEGIVNEGGA